MAPTRVDGVRRGFELGASDRELRAEGRSSRPSPGPSAKPPDPATLVICLRPWFQAPAWDGVTGWPRRCFERLVCATTRGDGGLAPLSIPPVPASPRHPMRCLGHPTPTGFRRVAQGCTRSGLPWDHQRYSSQPPRGCVHDVRQSPRFLARGRRNPGGVGIARPRPTQGRLLRRQPWATRRNPVGVESCRVGPAALRRAGPPLRGHAPSLVGQRLKAGLSHPTLKKAMALVTPPPAPNPAGSSPA